MAKKETNKKNEKVKNKKSFFKDFKAELKKVIWPTQKQLINNTTAVITIVLITAAIVFVLDFTFENVNNLVVNQVKKIETSIHSEEKSSEENKTEENNNQDETKVEENNAETNN